MNAKSLITYLISADEKNFTACKSRHIFSLYEGRLHQKTTKIAALVIALKTIFGKRL